MSTTPDPLPSATVPRPAPAPVARSSSATLLGCGFALSFVLNIVFAFVVVLLCCGSLFFRGIDADAAAASLPEKHHSGSRTATDKIAIISIDGVIMEGMLGYAHKQLEQAGKDDSVKAAVLRINSPGGSITASEDLYRRIRILHDGDEEQKVKPRPVVVAMGSVAASGGYYIAAPADKIFAERSTLTGSIGVYASYPNIKELSEKWGFTFNTIKAGEIKDSGSMFRDMTEKERQVTQDMVNEAYEQFLEVVEKGRPQLKGKMLLRFTVTPHDPDPAARAKAPAQYKRYLADGGIFTATKAVEHGLIDEMASLQTGALEKAIKAAAGIAGISSYRAFKYEKRPMLADLFLNTQEKAGTGLDAGLVRSAFTPRLWYLAPGYEAAAIAAGAKE